MWDVYHGWNSVCSLFWVPCVALCATSVETQRLERRKNLVLALGESQVTAQGPGLLQALM